MSEKIISKEGIKIRACYQSKTSGRKFITFGTCVLLPSEIKLVILSNPDSANIIAVTVDKFLEQFKEVKINDG